MSHGPNRPEHQSHDHDVASPHNLPPDQHDGTNLPKRRNDGGRASDFECCAPLNHCSTVDLHHCPTVDHCSTVFWRTSAFDTTRCPGWRPETSSCIWPGSIPPLTTSTR